MSVPTHVVYVSVYTYAGMCIHVTMHAYMCERAMCVFHSVNNIGVFSAEKTVGLFWLNAAETWIDISSDTADRVSLILLYIQQCFISSQ